jgi:ParB-like chromosome segregation protein Spo0J
VATQPQPINDDDREQVRRLHAEGLGRNDIARAIGRSPSTVSKIAAALGLTFDRTATAVATEARKADARAMRAEIAIGLLEDVVRLRAQLFKSCTVFNFGGKENTFEQALIDEPTFADKRNILTAIGTAVDRAMKLDAYDKIDETLSGIDAWLDAMTGA